MDITSLWILRTIEGTEVSQRCNIDKNIVLDRVSLSCLSHLLSVSDEAEVRLCWKTNGCCPDEFSAFFKRKIFQMWCTIRFIATANIQPEHVGPVKYPLKFLLIYISIALTTMVYHDIPYQAAPMRKLHKHDLYT